MALVEVRDVARAHLNALTIPEAANKRFLLVGEALWLHDIALLLKEKYGKEYPRIPTRVLPKWLVNLSSYVTYEGEYMINTWDQ